MGEQVGLCCHGARGRTKCLSRSALYTVNSLAELTASFSRDNVHVEYGLYTMLVDRDARDLAGLVRRLCGAR